jgi:hypothetical protein
VWLGETDPARPGALPDPAAALAEVDA